MIDDVIPDEDQIILDTIIVRGTRSKDRFLVGCDELVRSAVETQLRWVELTPQR